MSQPCCDCLSETVFDVDSFGSMFQVFAVVLVCNGLVCVLGLVLTSTLDIKTVELAGSSFVSKYGPGQSEVVSNGCYLA